MGPMVRATKEVPMLDPMVGFIIAVIAVIYFGVWRPYDRDDD